MTVYPESALTRNRHGFLRPKLGARARRMLTGLARGARVVRSRLDDWLSVAGLGCGVAGTFVLFGQGVGLFGAMVGLFGAAFLARDR